MTAFSNRDAYRFALLLAGLSALRPLAVDAFLPAIPAITEGLHVSLAETQQALTVYMLSFGIMTLWHGALSDALGRRPVILACTLVFAIASFGCAQAASLGELLAWRAMQGLVGGVGVIIGRAIVRDTFTGIEAQRMMSRILLLVALVPAIAPVIGGWLSTQFSWHAVFLFMGVSGLLLFITCWFTLTETHPLHKRTPLAWRPLLSNYVRVGHTRRFCLLSAAITFDFAGLFVYASSAPVFLLQHLGLKPQQFLYMFGPIVAGIMLGSWLAGHMTGRRSAHDIIRLGYLLMFSAMLINLGYNLTYPPMLLPSILPLMLYATGMAMNIPPMTIMLMDQFPQLRGTASSLQGFSQSMLNAIVAGALAPLVWAHTQTLALAMMGFLLLGLGCYWWYRRQMGVTGRIHV